VLNRFESKEFLPATTVVYAQEYPIKLHVVGIGKMSRLNARCVPIVCQSVNILIFKPYTHI